MKELPTTNEFFDKNSNLPTTDEFFTPPKPSTSDLASSALSSIVTADHPLDNPAVDAFMQNTAPGRIMSAFGHAFAEGGQGGQLGIQPGSDTESALKKAGVFNDYMKGENDFGKAVNEAFIRPAAVALDTEFRGVQAGLGAIGAGIQQTSQEMFGHAPGVLGEIPAMTEYMLTTPAGMEIHAVPPEISQARSLAVIGEDEGAYFGLKEPTPEQAVAREKASEAVPSEPVAETTTGEQLVSPSAVENAETAPEAPQDIHAVARDVAPDVFHEYDPLSKQRDFLGDTIRELVEKRQSDAEAAAPNYDAEIADMQAKMQTANARSRNRMQAKIDDLTAQREDFINNEVQKASPDIEFVRKRYQAIDARMRELAPDVSAAYREAQNRMPPEEEQTVTQEVAPTASETAPAPTTAALPEQSPEQIVQKVAPDINQQLSNISKDVSQKLVAAGRPLEEADAASQLIAQHYKSISDMGWTKGTPEEIYERDSANILEGKSTRTRKGELNQSVYHGSPHKFDKFTLSHIGSGEGNQAFGWGLYFTNNKGIAEFYRESLKPQDSVIKKTFLGEKPFNPNKELKTADAKQEFAVHQDVEKVINNLKKKIAKVESGVLKDVPESYAKALEKDVKRLSNVSINKETGQLYEVDIPDDAHFLQWDKPIGEQPSIVKNALKDSGLWKELKDNLSDFSSPMSTRGKLNGENIYSYLEWAAELGKGDVGQLRREKGITPAQAASEYLNDLGVKGTKYPAGTIAGNAKGHNYVVYDDAAINTLKTYYQKARGKIRLATDDAKAAITLFKTADASTFIHETGHSWLDEMMRYAKAEDAPAGLLKDRDAVNAWLGVKEDAEISRAQHEKFARGFERYLMEGTAPSKELASVFAKFKQWLTDIYQTVQKLRSPITDDIRSVFDRMLAGNSEETVIAPERKSADIIDNIHEKLAAKTPPEQAAGVADNVRATIDRLAKQEPEIYDELKTAESSAGTPSGPSAAPSAPAGAPEAAEPAPKQSNEISTGRGDIAPEGKPVQREPEPGNPNARLGRSESKFVDKAGNIRLDNLNTPEDINAVIRETANENDNFMGARRGKISDDQVLSLADALGMDPKMLDERKLGQAFNAEQVVAARKLLIKSAENVRDLASKASEGNEADLMAYAEARTRHISIQEQVSGITAEAGRALRAFRFLQGAEEAKAVGEIIKESTGLDLYQLQQEAKAMSDIDMTPKKISQILNNSRKPTYKDKILEYYINSLISGPITHLRYSVGNALNALWTPLVEIPTAAGVGKIREFVTGKEGPNRVYLGEAGAQLHGILQGSQNGLQAAAVAWRTGISPALATEREFSFIVPKENAIGGKIGTVLNTPSRAVSAIHSFFKSIRYEQNIQGLAYRNAIKEGLAEGTDAFTNRIAELGTNPTEEMMKSATADSLKELFMTPTEYNSAAGSLNRFANSNLAAKIIMPFMKIGSEITKNAFIERTPLGLLSKGVRDKAFYAEGIPEGDMQLAKMATGVALMGGVSSLVLGGLATGDGPTDPKQRAVWLLNHRPNSIQIGSLTIPYQGLGHLGMLMRFSANMTETAHGWGEAQDGTKLAKAFMEGITRSVLDENFMRGLKDMLDAVYHPEEYGENYIRQFVTNWLPFSVGMGQVAKEVDPYHREAKSIFDAARAKIPFVSQDLLPRRDVFGEAMPNGANEAYASDPVIQRLESLQTGIGKIERKIRGVQLTDQQYDDYTRLAGRMTKMRLSNYVSIPGTANLPSGVQIKTINTMVDNSREVARRIVLMNNPDIIKQAINNKLSALKGGKP